MIEAAGFLILIVVVLAAFYFRNEVDSENSE